ncbi:MAG: hypothetical protein HRT44_07370 [Bdellovibrionales bacterium]|nr:hypothetical protein [Bdellovibrionales bacterium]NQZ19057.1 hypothetical protein [Bdellovibrionales bacterium]
MKLILIFLSLFAFSAVNLQVQGFFSHSDEKYVYLQSDNEQMLLDKKLLTKKQMKKIFSSGKKEVELLVPPKALVKKISKAPSKKMKKKFKLHAKKKRAKALKQGK